ncbi:MAG: 2-amino-4-ketopentanoate thiolase [Clostridiales Family XIII bacterium]|jgi:hypothetical protein|nr:2-amino-4-ketopentanoate thiolase [Clostridiales Family XIII bacterium]
MKIEKGHWVRIRRTLLSPEERAPQVPEDTKNVPFIMWNKGILTQDAEIGEDVTVVTTSGREEFGELTEANPNYDLNYGDYVPELREIGIEVREWIADTEEA